jgi:hypothetical protein
MKVSDYLLQHELAIMDCKAALCCATRKDPAILLTEFSTRPQKFQFNTFHPATGNPILIKPDAFVQMRAEDGEGIKEHRFFMELDRSTESQQVLLTKVLAYRTFYKQGGLAIQLGHEASAFRNFPFRILVVFLSAERRNNTAMRLVELNPPVRRFVLLTTLDEFIANPLGPIWMQPKDIDGAIRSGKHGSSKGFSSIL